ncbi:MAG: FHA domain-containing protein [Chloroflexota bacterium]
MLPTHHNGMLRRTAVLAAAVAVVVGVTASPPPAAAWGSIYGSSTHQYIDDQAWAVLGADPAFSAALFPTKAQIDAHEGVNWFGTGDWFDYLVGPGPDSEGASPYSWHYYNPVTTEGDGPTATADEYVALVTAQAAANGDAAGLGAAWAAHFMADMYVPFHVVGAYRDTVEATYKAQGGASASKITLPADITGPIDLCYGCQIKDWSWFGADNFGTEVGRYLGISTPVTTGAGGNSHLNWFDPWYYNGTWPASVKSSSHVVWEGAVSHDAGTVSGYDARWTNGVPSFGSPGSWQKASVNALARAAAGETRADIVNRTGAEKDALNHAVTSAATIWRASISALRPGIKVEAGPESGTFKVTAIIDNVAAETATGVRVRLAGSGCEVKDAAERGIPGAVKHDESISWNVKADKPEACQLTLEAIGTFRTTPDLGYAKVQKPLGQVVGNLDLVFCIDVTASMEDDIASVKAAASGIVDKIATKGAGYRVAVVAYRDWNDTEGYALFEDFGFSSDKATIVSNINSLSVGGGDDDPEAVFEALMRAIDSRAIGGWRANVNKVVILMGDAPPHDPSAEGFTGAIVAKAAFDADPVVIHTILVGNEGDVSAAAGTAFAAIAAGSSGTMVTAADSTKVVDAIGKAIETITPPGPDPMLVAAGVGVGVVVLLFLLLLVRRSGRRRPVPAMTAGAWGAGPAPGTWQGPQPVGAWGASGPWQAQQQPGSWGAAPVQGTWQGQPAVPVPPAAQLVFGHPSNPAALRFQLAATQVLGSAPGCQILLADPSVSAQHAQVYASGPAWAIVDLGGASGTWVNGQRIAAPAWLRSGDTIVIGPYQMVLTT